MNVLEGKNILLGVTGGIAAFKAASLTSQLVKMGANVRVVMTKNATKFVAPLTFQTLSRNPVYVDMFSPSHWQPEHISLAESADLLVLAPATANIIGKLAHGIADDLLTTVALAVKCQIILAPAMNSNMFDNPIVQDNLKYLKDKGFFIVAPEYGPLACGREGKGRLADLDVIVETIKMMFTPKDLKGARILVTAGPTREWIDPIRFISNRSSGKMGFSLARAARDRGAQVVLISGPTHLKSPPYLESVSVETAEQMRDAVVSRFEWAEVVIMSAAVADYRPKERMNHKLKKTGSDLMISLTPTPDILAELGRRKGDRILVGFAAETGHLVANAFEKLRAKNLDLIVANNVLERGAGFESDTNIVTMIDKSGKIERLPILPKEEVAHKILDKVSEMIRSEG